MLTSAVKGALCYVWKLAKVSPFGSPEECNSRLSLGQNTKGAGQQLEERDNLLMVFFELHKANVGTALGNRSPRTRP